MSLAEPSVESNRYDSAIGCDGQRPMHAVDVISEPLDG